LETLGIVAFVGMGGMTMLLNAVHLEPCGETVGSLA
jgi:hypothetical protein